MRRGRGWSSDKTATVILGSCFDIAPRLPDDLSSLIIIDPPYGVLRPHESNRYKTQWKDNKWGRAEWARLLPHIWRVLQRGGRLLVFGKKEFFHEVYNFIKDDSLGYDELTWVHDGKDNMWATHQELSNSERIAVFYRKADSGCMRLPDRPNHSDMLPFPKDRSFESMKPPALMKHLIERYSAKGDVVVDLCMNTGVTGYAARLAGRRFVGIEKVPSIFEKAVANVSV